MLMLMLRLADSDDEEGWYQSKKVGDDVLRRKVMWMWMWCGW